MLHRLKSLLLDRALVRDLLALSFLSVLIGAIAIRWEVFERIWLFTRKYDDWQLDEIVSALMLLPPIFAIFAWRRWVELRAEVRRRLQAEQQLIRARDLAEGATRSKSEFLANMSHEIRTPMNGIIGMTDLALGTELTEQQHGYLQTVRTSAESLMVIINDILDFSRIEAGKLIIDSVAFNLPEVMQDAVRAMSVQAHRKGLELLYDVAPGVPEFVSGDPVRVRQVIFNLLGNAVKFTERGQIVFRARARQDGNLFRTEFEVRDTGIGIAQEKRASIFAAFSQADGTISRRFGGTGLGLSITAKLLKLMNGTMRVESELNEGSAFYVEIPFLVVDAPPGVEPPASIEALQGIKVLIVDDNATNREILDAMLRYWGLAPAAASSGPAAIEALRAAYRAKMPFALVLTDFQMPGMDGLSLARLMTEDPELTSTPVLMLSSVDRQLSLSEVQDFGVSAYISKPVVRSELRRVLAQVFGLSARSAALRAPAPAAGYHSEIGKLHLLLAEDNCVNQRVVISMLHRMGHDVVLAVNGTQAVQAAANGCFDVVLMDVQMPDMDGLEATKRIRVEERSSQRPPLPIIGLTANAMKGDDQICLQAGMDGYVAKPFTIDRLAAEIGRVLHDRGELARK